MSFDLERLYSLLPSIYRIRDAELAQPDQSVTDEQTQPLKAPLKSLLSVLTYQVAVLEEDLAQLYDDQFIETCQEWVIPYIGDLVGYQLAHDVLPQSLRVEVANTVNYRRRKGTATMLEQLARDVTGWYIHVVEFYKLLLLTQHMNRLHAQNGTLNLRHQRALEHLDTPFDTLPHTIEVRDIATQQGHYNLSNVGIFVWRLNAYSLTDSPAFKVDNYRYLFSPLGNNTQLFSHPQLEDTLTQLTGMQALAMPITRGMLTHFLSSHYGEGKSLSITVDGRDAATNPRSRAPQNIADFITVADLSDIEDEEGNVISWSNMPREQIAIDPVLGRIAFPRRRGKRAPKEVSVTFHYGFSTEMGGGEYSRLDSFTLTNPFTGQLLPSTAQVPAQYTTIQQALDVLADSGIVEITGNGRYNEALKLHVPANKFVELRAAEGCRPLLELANVEQQSSSSLTPEFVISGEQGAQVVLNGLLISNGRLRVRGNISRLTLRHCTLVPGLSVVHDYTKRRRSNQEALEQSLKERLEHVSPDETMIRKRREEDAEEEHYPLEVSMVVETSSVVIELDHCILGGIRSDGEATVRLLDSIVDATSQHALAFGGLDDATTGGTLYSENSTIIGRVHCAQVELASNTIFLARHRGKDRLPVHVERRQDGCIRFSYLPVHARVPCLYHCQPETAQETEWVHPQFTSLHYGEAGYCQLSRANTQGITSGASDEAELGAFHHLYQPQRETNLRIRLNEYLRLPLEAGVFYLT